MASLIGQKMTTTAEGHNNIHNASLINAVFAIGQKNTHNATRVNTGLSKMRRSRGIGCISLVEVLKCVQNMMNAIMVQVCGQSGDSKRAQQYTLAKMMERRSHVDW